MHAEGWSTTSTVQAHTHRIRHENLGFLCGCNNGTYQHVLPRDKLCCFQSTWGQSYPELGGRKFRAGGDTRRQGEGEACWPPCTRMHTEIESNVAGNTHCCCIRMIMVLHAHTPASLPASSSVRPFIFVTFPSLLFYFICFLAEGMIA